MGDEHRTNLFKLIFRFVEIFLQDGTSGIGAGNPSEYVVGETIEQSIEALDEKSVEFLIGRDIREFNQLTFEVWKNFPDNPGARAAVRIGTSFRITTSMAQAMRSICSAGMPGSAPP